MKKTRLLLCVVIAMLVMPVCALASESDEAAIRKQIKTLESGIKKHDYSKVKKVVKKPHSSFCDFKRMDKLIGKSFLKSKSKNSRLDVVNISINGNKADVTIDYGFYDCSYLYYEAHNRLWIEGKHKQKSFSKMVKQLDEKSNIEIYRIGRKDEVVEMQKIGGKWVFKTDPYAIFVNMYSCGYIRLQQISNDIVKNKW